MILEGICVFECVLGVVAQKYKFRAVSEDVSGFGDVVCGRERAMVRLRHANRTIARSLPHMRLATSAPPPRGRRKGRKIWEREKLCIHTHKRSHGRWLRSRPDGIQCARAPPSLSPPQHTHAPTRCCSGKTTCQSTTNALRTWAPWRRTILRRSWPKVCRMCERECERVYACVCMFVFVCVCRPNNAR